MPTKLYVTNLSASATQASVRHFFGACGDVLDVEFLAERSARPPSAAYVTMATMAAASLARDKLHGKPLHDSSVMVSIAPASPSDERRSKDNGDAPPNVRITQQYRDRHASFYELDAGGILLTLRFVFPPDEQGDWRLQVNAAGNQAGVEVSALTRQKAFEAAISACEQSESSLSLVRWAEVTRALKSVRAI